MIAKIEDVQYFMKDMKSMYINHVNYEGHDEFMKLLYIIEDMKPKIDIITLTDNNGASYICGVACVITFMDKKKMLQHRRWLALAEDTSENRLELTAICQALSILRKPAEVHIHTEKEYIYKGIAVWLWRWAQDGFLDISGKPRPNADLWEQIFKYSQTHELKAHYILEKKEIHQKLKDLAQNVALVKYLNKAFPKKKGMRPDWKVLFPPKKPLKK